MLFIRFIESVQTSPEKHILIKTSGMNFFNYPPYDQLDAIKDPLFYKDASQGFRTTSLMGIDIKLLIAETLVFCAFDFLFGNTSLSLLLLLIYQTAIRELRSWIGEDNISEKTMIDERFLI